ncbi:serine-threonine protein kinase [Streptomyces sp. NPDC059909]|uniref:serine-threonine protein kinase n=1 Tax=Streptomyces sp. NPDC059909 TaxID=3346998 RepID=UPI00364F5BA0
MTEMTVEPYREITFDADGDSDAAQGQALGKLAVTDLVMFAHGWNNSRSVATRFYTRFFEPFPGLLPPGARVGYAGVVWPSMMFTDEPIPDFGALAGVFPGREPVLGRLAALLGQEPDSREAFDEFGSLVRELVDASAEGLVGDTAGATAGDVAGEGPPAFLHEDPVEVCRLFTEALDGQEPSLAIGGGLTKLWKGAKEVLRQATYYTMKRRAGTVGERGLGPVLGQLSRSSPGLRVHLVGHSMGARLIAFALRGLPDGARPVKSVTLLQGAFSHYAFAPSLPHEKGRSGVLRDMQARVDGPVVACYSRHDSALGVIYPLASRMAGDSSTVVGLDRRWWAVGHDGIQAVAGTRQLTLEAALRDGLPTGGCVNVDTASVVRRGGPPSGAHSDILHPELARVVLAAGRVGR